MRTTKRQQAEALARQEYGDRAVVRKARARLHGRSGYVVTVPPHGVVLWSSGNLGDLLDSLRERAAF